jgi:hypothetical protein
MRALKKPKRYRVRRSSSSHSPGPMHPSMQQQHQQEASSLLSCHPGAPHPWGLPMPTAGHLLPLLGPATTLKPSLGPAGTGRKTPAATAPSSSSRHRCTFSSGSCTASTCSSTVYPHPPTGCSTACRGYPQGWCRYRCPCRRRRGTSGPVTPAAVVRQQQQQAYRMVAWCRPPCPSSHLHLAGTPTNLAA